MGTLSWEVTLSFTYLFPSQEGFTLKGKNLLPQEQTLSSKSKSQFARAMWPREANRKSRKLFPLFLVIRIPPKAMLRLDRTMCQWHCLIMLYICTKFCQSISKGLELQTQTVVVANVDWGRTDGCRQTENRIPISCHALGRREKNDRKTHGSAPIH